VDWLSSTRGFHHKFGLEITEKKVRVFLKPQYIHARTYGLKYGKFNFVLLKNMTNLGLFFSKKKPFVQIIAYSPFFMCPIEKISPQKRKRKRKPPTQKMRIILY